jgi:hypothetical protein
VYAPPEPVALFGDPGRTRLQVKGATVGLAFNAGEEIEAVAQLNVEELTLIVTADTLDGFLSKLIGDEDLKAAMPLALSWSSLKGVNFSGGAGLTISRPAHLEVGPLVIQQLDVTATSTISDSAPPDFQVAVTVNVAGDLGPLTFVADGIGFKVGLVFEEGNAGPFDVRAGFKPPSGLGLSIDGGGFKGGGFLKFEPEESRYSGHLELEFENRLTLKAFGLLTTKLPNGQPGFSLLILISAEFAPGASSG